MGAISDRELIERHLDGDREAFARIYDRYAAALYDVARSMTRHDADAADIVQDTFVIAATRLDQLRDRDRLKPWLFSVLRHEVYRRTKRRQRERPLEEMDDMVISDGSDIEAPLDEADREAELAALVRDAEAGLDERDRLALELSVRQGLEGADLAAALGVSAQQSYSIVFRMRQRVERSMGAVVVARAGRSDCPELSNVLTGWDGTFDRLVRKRVSRHIDGCETCESTRRRLDPLALVRTAPAFALPIGLRERVLDAVGGLGAGGSAADGDQAEGVEQAHGAEGPKGSSGSPVRPIGPRALGPIGPRALGPVDAEGFPIDGPSGHRGRLAAAVVVVLLLLAALFLLRLRTDEVVTATAPTAPEPRSGASMVVDEANEPGLGAGTSTPGTSAEVGDEPGDDLAPGGDPDGGTSGDDGGIGPGGGDPGSTGGLTVTPRSLDLSLVNATGVIRLANRGTAALTPVVTTAGPVTVGPVGAVEPGAERSLPVTFNAGSLAEGDHEGTVTITVPGEQVTVPVHARVDHAPVVRAGEAAIVLFRPGGPVCGPFTATVQATVGDESPISSVVLSWTAPGSVSSKAMNPQPDGRTWTATIGPFPVVGSFSYVVTATDARGNEASITRSGLVRNC